MGIYSFASQTLRQKKKMEGESGDSEQLFVTARNTDDVGQVAINKKYVQF